jgi:hypothetical protein
MGRSVHGDPERIGEHNIVKGPVSSIGAIPQSHPGLEVELATIGVEREVGNEVRYMGEPGGCGCAREIGGELSPTDASHHATTCDGGEDGGGVERIQPGAGIPFRQKDGIDRIGQSGG